jgi:NTP pyrophosphatase (non-canonical NTP hydrolase)
MSTDQFSSIQTRMVEAVQKNGYDQSNVFAVIETCAAVAQQVVDEERALMPKRDGELTFNEVAFVNFVRAKVWHSEMEPWSGADWANAMEGEAGEMMEAAQVLVLATSAAISAGLAGNVVKKIRRQETGTRGAVDPDISDLVEQLGSEVSDMILYGILLLTKYDVNAADALVKKFNFISEREGINIFLRQPSTLNLDPRDTLGAIEANGDIKAAFGMNDVPLPLSSDAKPF